MKNGNASHEQTSEGNEMPDVNKNRVRIAFTRIPDGEAEIEFGIFCVKLAHAGVPFSLIGENAVLLDKKNYRSLPEDPKQYLDMLGEPNISIDENAEVSHERKLISR